MDMRAPHPIPPAAPTRMARALGLAGLLPFAAGALAAWAWPDAGVAARAMLAYGATILAFLGGLHWALAARGAQRPLHYAWAVAPSLLAWLALLLPTGAGLALLAVGLVACYAVDRRVFPAHGLAGWLGLRALLTAGAVACCVAAALAA